MDPRKQKRLGPAPIASFEKSFEDTTTPHIGGNAAVQNAIHQTETEMPDINRNSDEMEPPHGNITRETANTKTITTTTTTPAAATTTTTTTIGREVIQQLQQQQLRQQLLQQQQQQQQKPSISVSQTATAGSTKTKDDGNTAIATTATTTALATKPRPPPLKATAAASRAATTTTTLVSSGEQQVTFRGATTLTTPSTPRIELSRASSSSHHEEDSRDSSPENVFEQVGTGTLQEAIGLGFREEGALELRSSTEELYFMDPEQKKEEQEKMQQQQQHQQPQQQHQQHQQQPKRSSPLMFKFEDHQSYLQQHQRKDSASSEVAALLCISGRTSRISSVGSQGSAVSRLSAVSGVSRSPSPHRMLLETSFCGPKPLENLVDGRVNTAVEPGTAEILEQVLLARKHDPTQAVLAEGIHVESSPKRTKPTTLSNGDPKINAKIALQNRPAGSTTGTTAKPPTMGRQRQSTKSPGQMIVGKTTSGTEYIRINLKPDHMYDDKGVGPNERVVEAPNTLAPVSSKSSQKKPITLSLGRNAMDETRLTPTASPKPTRHNVLTKDTIQHGSRSPSPANVNVSRKSSFSSLFRGVSGKDSPDSPRERARSRSKSKDRQTPQSQNATPNKQKSVLAIFKPNKRGSNAGAEAKSSKSSSPIDGHDSQQQQHQQHRSKSNTPLESATSSRPASRLRYYDEPIEGVIHIPLHTPPEEKETRKLLQGIAQLTAEPMRPVAAPVTASQLAAAAAALKPVGTRIGSGAGVTIPRPPQIEKLQRIENLDAIHALPQDDDNKDRSWSIEVQRHSSQESQETVGSEGSYASAIRMSARGGNLTHVKEQPTQENGVAAAAEIHRLPSEDSNAGIAELKTVETIAMVSVSAEQCMTEDAVAKERRRLLFATRLGSGSQEQIFSTQFSISKTESQSSQLSEQVPETIPENVCVEHLQRTDTVIRRADDFFEKTEITTFGTKGPLKRLGSTEAAGHRPKSISTSEDEKTPQQTQTVAAIVLRRKESREENRKSRSTSEEDADATARNSVSSQRHSRYLENFDVRRKYNENVPRKPKRQSVSSDSNKGEAAQLDETPDAVEVTTTRNEPRQPILPQPPPPSTAPSPSPPPQALQQQRQQTSIIGSRSPTPPTKVGAAHRSQSQSPIERSKQTPTKPPRTSTPTRRSSQTASPPSPSSTASPQMTLKAAQQQPDRQSVHSTDEPNESSESERDSELAANSATADPKRRHLPRHVGTIEDHESTGLVSQESFDDELPYIPTTLPEERAQGVALIPMKERANMELKTCPVDRPRSTTPLNPSHLEEYCGIMAATPPEPTFIASGAAPVRGEKLRISLPRKDSAKEKAQNSKSPRRTSNASGKTWFEFAEEGLRATTKDGKDLERKDSNKQLLPQKTNEETKSKTTTTTTTTIKKTPGKSGTNTRKLSGHWIDFENIPEKRKPAKRITALPKDNGTTANSAVQRNHHHAAGPASAHHHHHGHGHNHGHGHGPPDVAASAVNSDGKMHYNYVKPEDCQCECHEVDRGESSGTPTISANTTGASDSACEVAAIGVAANGAANKALTNVDLLQQGEDMLPLLDPDIQDGVEPSDSSRDYSCYTDDEADVPLRQSGTSHRHRTTAPKNDEFPRRDGSRSPRSRKFPDHRYS